MATKTLLTIDEFEQLPVEEGKKLELDEGELRVMSPAMPRHDRVKTRTAYELEDLTRKNQAGTVFVEAAFRLSEGTVRIPDVSFVSAERMRSVDLDRIIDGAPSLAIEIVSPTDLAEELARKVDQYLAAGAQAVWVVYPSLREVHVHRKGRAITVLGETDMLSGEDLLPGFSLPIRDLFE